MMKADEVAQDETQQTRLAAPSCDSRRPYAAPGLRYLGTVYELTLSGSGSASEIVLPKPRSS